MNQQIDLDSGFLCRRIILSRSKYEGLADRRCHHISGHQGNCLEFPFLTHLKATHPRVAQKIVRDSIMTTGAAWKSEEAGPNRILRWVMLLTDEELLRYGINMANLKPQVISKLREKAADYDSCVKVGMWLTRIAYEMPDAPVPPQPIHDYLERLFGPMVMGRTTCTICLLPLSFNLFAEAQRGKAAIESCHKNPRMHTPENVGFAHRECNIAQGAKPVDEFYNWIIGIIRRARPGVIP